MKKFPLNPKGKNPPGTWAKRFAPKGSFTYYDGAERLDITVRHFTNLVRDYNVPTGLVTRTVKLANGSIVRRRIRVLSPTALEYLILRHFGYLTNSEITRRKSQQ